MPTRTHQTLLVGVATALLAHGGCSFDESTGAGPPTSTAGAGGAGGPGTNGGHGGEGGSAVVCGDGVRAGDEQCDEGEQNSNTTADACREDCSQPSCGDAVVDPEHDEACDTASLAAGEICSPDCHQSVITTDLGVSGDAYDLARDNHGGIHLLWRAGNELRYGRVETGQLVGAQTLPGSAGVHTRFTRPRLAVHPAGETVHTSWINAVGSIGQYLYYSWRDANGDWQPRQTVWNGGADQRIAVPAIGVGADGTVHIIGERRQILPSEGDWRIVSWRKLQGQSWPADPDTIHGPTGTGWRGCSLFTDRNGGVHASWKGPNQAGKYRYAANGQSLAAGTTIDIPKPAGESHVSNGDSYVTDAGEVPHGFVTFPNLGIFHTAKPAGGDAFPPPLPVGSADTSDVYDPWPALGVDPSGRVLVSWVEDRDALTNQNAHFVWLGIHDVQDGWTLQEWSTTAHIHVWSRTAIAVNDVSTYLLWRNGQDQLMLARFTFVDP